MIWWLGCTLYADLKVQDLDTATTGLSSEDAEDGDPNEAEGGEPVCEDWGGSVTLAGEAGVDVAVSPDEPLYEGSLEGDGWVCDLACDDPRFQPSILVDGEPAALPTEADGKQLMVAVMLDGRDEDFAGACTVEISNEGSGPLLVELSFVYPDTGSADTGSADTGTAHTGG